MIYQKQCPTCGKDIMFSRMGDLNVSIRNNSGCRSCFGKRRIKSEEERKKISDALTGRKLPGDVKKKIGMASSKQWGNPAYRKKLSISHSGENNPLFGKHLSVETRRKMKQNHFNVHGENNPMFGKLHSEETKRKIRESLAQRLLKYGIRDLSFNPIACKIIDEYGRQNGYNFQHALNGGEYTCIGYFVDGYDKKKNVVIEVDEPHHNKPSQKEKDIIRQKRIESYLGCKFIRIPYEEKI